MRVFIVQNETQEPIGVYTQEKQAKDAASLHEKRTGFGHAMISTFDLKVKAFVLCERDTPVAVCSTLDNLKAMASLMSDPDAYVFTLDATPLRAAQEPA